MGRTTELELALEGILDITKSLLKRIKILEKEVADLKNRNRQK